MPLFGKKNKKTEENSAPTKGSVNRANLKQMFDESVPESIRTLLRENESFKVGENKYAILILDLNEYGFKNAKQKNTSQGEFIEYTKNSNISAWVPAEGYLDGENELGKEIVGIIPNAITLENLEEIELTREAKYLLAVLDENLETTFTDKTVTLADIQTISEGDKDITDFIDVSALGGGDDDEDDENIEVSDEDLEPAAEVDDDELFGNDDDNGYEEDDNADEDDDMPSDDSDENYDDSGDDEYNEPYVSNDDTGDDFVDDVENMNFNSSDDEDEDLEEEDEYEPDEGVTPAGIVDRPLPGTNPQNLNYTEEDFNASYARKFYSEDLDIEFDSSAFDAIFANRKPFKKFDDNRDETGDHQWLNKQLNQQARDANSYLETLHAENLQEMRARYMQTVSRFCEDIVKDVDPTNPNTTYYKQKKMIDERKQALTNNAEREIQKLKDEQIKRFEAEIQNVRNRAADEAETSFRSKFTAQHEKEIAEIATKYNRDIEASYCELQQSIHNERREAAKRMLDTAITETLIQIEKEYNVALMAENEQYEQFAKQLDDTYEKYRSEEMMRVHTLNEEITRNDLVAKIQQECAARIESIEAEYNVKTQNMEDAAKKSIDAANERVEYMDAQCKERVADERKRVESLQQRLDDMVHDVKIESERKDREYESRINELKQENKIWVDKYDILDATQKRHHVLATVLVVAIALVMIAAGFIMGTYFALNQNAKTDTAPTNATVVTEVNETLG